ncbi:hypothetical protein PUN28_019364 [Cardiocondyla obscurior]|uniref:TIL domain-containing protein n=1 Tax=Cardiocondyla obscurior TaxID=286306 RepID=A0AAW2ED88_9HYME
MRFVLFPFVVLIGAHCGRNLNNAFLATGENVDYQSHRDLDAFLSMECEEHEKYSECSGDSTCQKTCENRDRWETMACTRTKICIQGCVCEDGYVRNDSDTCVKEINCSRI